MRNDPKQGTRTGRNFRLQPDSNPPDSGYPAAAPEKRRRNGLVRRATRGRTSWCSVARLHRHRAVRESVDLESGSESTEDPRQSRCCPSNFCIGCDSGRLSEVYGSPAMRSDIPLRPTASLWTWTSSHSESFVRPSRPTECRGMDGTGFDAASRRTFTHYARTTQSFN